MATDTRATICESCGKLISRNEPVCPLCGAKRTGWQTAGVLSRLFARHGVTSLLLAVNVIVYVCALALSGRPSFSFERGLFYFLGPKTEVDYFLGSLSPRDVLQHGELWRLFTATFLHAGLLHIFFNLSWLRSVGGALEQEFGHARFAIVYLGSGLAGWFACLAVGQPALGASGAIFGLIGAGWSYGKRRGGSFGEDLRRQFLSWMISGVLFTLVFSSSISVPGHLGGLAGGLALGWLLASGPQRYNLARRDPPWLTVLAGVLLACVPLSFAAALVAGLRDPAQRALLFPGAHGSARALDELELREMDLAALGFQGWRLSVPASWPERALADGSGVVLDAGVGANLMILRVDWPGDAPASARELLDAIDPENGAFRVLGASADLASIDAERDSFQGEKAGLVHLRRLADGRYLLLHSWGYFSAEDAGLRTLFARIAASVRAS